MSASILPMIVTNICFQHTSGSPWCGEGRALTLIKVHSCLYHGFNSSTTAFYSGINTSFSKEAPQAAHAMTNICMQQALVSNHTRLLLPDASSEASYELKWKPWLRLKKVLTLDNGWSAQSETRLNAEWTWKWKSEAQTLQQWGSLWFHSVTKSLGSWPLPANSHPTPLIWNSNKERQPGSLC